MASWGRKIVIAEPAPGAALAARYLAPTFTTADADILDVLIPAGVVLGGGLVFGLLGGGAGAVAATVFGDGVRAPVWIGFDLVVTACVIASYVLVARHGLRFTEEDHGEIRAQRVLVEQGNVAWSCLPENEQALWAEQLRAMNAAARLLRVDPEDAEARAVLERNSRALHELTLVQRELGARLPV